MRRDLELPASDSFSTATLTRIWKNLRTRFVVTGSYVANGKDAGSPIRLQVTLQDTRSGNTVASDSETGSEATLFDLVDHVGRVLRAKLGVPDLLGPEVVTSKTVLPRNLESQRLYAEGLRELRLLDATAAAETLTRAIQAEPTYALAHAALAEAWAALGYEAKAAEEATLAYRYSAPLAPEDALLVEAKHRELNRQSDQAIQIYKQLCEFAPSTLDYRIKLALAQMRSGQPNAARETLRPLERLSMQDPKVAVTEALISESIGDFKAELGQAAKAETRARARGAKAILAQALLRQCWAFHQLGRESDAIAKAQEARATFTALHDRAGEAQALKNLADIVDDDGDHVQGRKLYESALALFRDIGDQLDVAGTLNNLAYAVKDQGDLAGARRLFEESLKISREIADQARQALALNGVGIVLWRQGDLRAARQAFEQALAIHQQRGDQSRAATLLNNVGLVFEDQGSLAEAKARLEESLRILRTIGDRYGIARNLGNIGDLLVKQGDLSVACENYQEQITIGKSIPEPRQVAYGLHGLGTALLAEGDLKMARAKLAEALALRQKMGEKGLVAETRLVLAELAVEEGNPSEALGNATQAADEFEKEDESDLAAEAYATIAHSQLVQNHLAEAARALEKAERLAVNSTDFAIRLQMSLERARACAARGEAAKASNELNTVIADASQRGYLGYELEARFALAAIAFKTGPPSAGAGLEAIGRQAKLKGFGLIFQKADRMLHNSKRSVSLW
jgi:tetratricopeptide (TPR) repeat protein